MNERIKHLAEQSGYKHPDAVGVCEDYAYFDHKKFAELILKDCFNVVIGDSRFHDSKNIINAAKTVAIEHFGVTE